MSVAESAAVSARHPFEFRGTGGAYFRIWIVNLILTILTLGIYGAWAKVRTRRYFNGSTWVAGHAFDYHASGLRILIGRAIALALFVAYSVTVRVLPPLAALWFLFGLLLFPWLVNSSIRFNARNTSYRNVRFNFIATDIEALMAYVVWPIVGFITLGLLWPLAQRQKDYFYINNHTYGRRYFETEYSAWKMYGIFLLALGLMIVFFSVAVGVAVAIFKDGLEYAQLSTLAKFGWMAIMMIAFYAVLLLIAPFIHAMIVNLNINHTVFDDKHKLESTMSPLVVAWIMISNVALCLITLGIYYPWAKVRLARYRLEHLTLIASSDLDSYISEVFDTQSAVGEEIGTMFDFDFGL